MQDEVPGRLAKAARRSNTYRGHPAGTEGCKARLYMKMRLGRRTGRQRKDGTGYGLHSGESHEGVGAEGAKRGARISQAKGQRRFQIILVRLFGQMRGSSVLFFAHRHSFRGRAVY